MVEFHAVLSEDPIREDLAPGEEFFYFGFFLTVHVYMLEDFTVTTPSDDSFTVIVYSF